MLVVGGPRRERDEVIFFRKLGMEMEGNGNW